MKNKTKILGVRFDAETLEAIRRLAEADSRSVSEWVRLQIMRIIRK